MKYRLCLATLIFAGAIETGLADDQLRIRPGMTLAEVTELLKPTCTEYIVGGESEKYVTCLRGEGLTPEVVTATVNASDQTVYIQWRHQSETPADMEALARDLGFVSPQAECTIFDETVACWKDADGATFYNGGHNASDGIHTFYLRKDGLK